MKRSQKFGIGMGILIVVAILTGLGLRALMSTPDPMQSRATTANEVSPDEESARTDRVQPGVQIETEPGTSAEVGSDQPERAPASQDDTEPRAEVYNADDVRGDASKRENPRAGPRDDR